MKYLEQSLKDNRGFTLIELMVVLAITGIISTVIVSFLITDLRIFSKTTDYSQAQYNAQQTMNRIVNKVIEGSGITDNSIKNDGCSIIDVKEDSSYDRVIFKIPKLNGTDYFSLRYDTSEKKLYYNTGNSDKDLFIDESIFAENIEDIVIELPAGEDRTDYKSVIITITSKKNDEKVTVKNRVYFRNK